MPRRLDITRCFDTISIPAKYRIKLFIYADQTVNDLTVSSFSDSSSTVLATYTTSGQNWVGIDITANITQGHTSLKFVYGDSSSPSIVRFYIKDLHIYKVVKAQVSDSDMEGAGRRLAYYEGCKMSSPSINVDSTDTIDGGPVVVVNTVAANTPSSQPVGSPVARAANDGSVRVNDPYSATSTSMARRSMVTSYDVFGNPIITTLDGKVVSATDRVTVLNSQPVFKSNNTTPTGLEGRVVTNVRNEPRTPPRPQQRTASVDVTVGNATITLTGKDSTGKNLHGTTVLEGRVVTNLIGADEGALEGRAVTNFTDPTALEGRVVTNIYEDNPTALEGRVVVNLDTGVAQNRTRNMGNRYATMVVNLFNSPSLTGPILARVTVNYAINRTQRRGSFFVDGIDGAGKILKGTLLVETDDNGMPLNGRAVVNIFAETALGGRVVTNVDNAQAQARMSNPGSRVVGYTPEGYPLVRLSDGRIIVDYTRNSVTGLEGRVVTNFTNPTALEGRAVVNYTGADTTQDIFNWLQGLV